MLRVEQMHREAAAELFEKRYPAEVRTAQMMRKGSLDSSIFVQAFARFEQQLGEKE